MSLQITALLDALAASQGDKLVREGVASWLGGAAAPKVKKAMGGKVKAGLDGVKALNFLPQNSSPCRAETDSLTQASQSNPALAPQPLSFSCPMPLN